MLRRSHIVINVFSFQRCKHGTVYVNHMTVMQHLSNLVTEITELCQQIHPSPLKKSAPLQRKIPVETRGEKNTPQRNKGCK